MPANNNLLEFPGHRLVPYQQDFICSNARVTVVEAATKTGKTTACLIWLLSRAYWADRPANCWWVAPTKAQAGIGFRRAKHLLQAVKAPISFKSRAKTIVLGKAEVSFDDDNLLDFRSAHRPDDLYGEDVRAVVIDEATRCKPETWAAVFSTLTKTQGQAKIIGNVKGRNNWVYQLARRAEQHNDPKLFQYYKWTYHDALREGLLDPKAIAEAQALLPEHEFRELYLAEPAEDGTNPFGLQHVVACTREGLSSAPGRYFGVDLAKYKDWTAIIGLDNTGQVACFEHFQRDWQATEHIVLHAVGHHPTYIDSTGVGDPIVERLQRQRPFLHGFHFSAYRKQQLIEALAIAIREHQIGFPRGRIQEELSAFELDYHNGRLRYSAPEGLHDDTVMALALAWHAYRRHADHRTFDFSIDP